MLFPFHLCIASIYDFKTGAQSEFKHRYHKFAVREEAKMCSDKLVLFQGEGNTAGQRVDRKALNDSLKKYSLDRKHRRGSVSNMSQ